MIAPKQLPFAPRPILTESFSSWLLRVAAANFVHLDELLRGFASHYGTVLPGGLPEHSLSEAAVVALSRFSRVAPESILALDLRRRIPNFNPAVLLSFPRSSYLNRRLMRRRAYYSFCLRCLRSGPFPYIRWEWTLAYFLCCPIHRTLLLDQCIACQEPDPLAFGSEPNWSCRSCGATLMNETAQEHCAPQDREMVIAVENAYRDMLMERVPHPVLAHPKTSRSIRNFVEDLLTLLTDGLGRFHSPEHCSRQDVLLIIASLINNTIPGVHPSIRRQQSRRGAILWANLLAVLPLRIGSQLEEASRRWPLVLRHRFASGLRLRIRQRWPYSPHRAAKDLDRRTERRELAIVFPLPPKPR